MTTSCEDGEKDFRLFRHSHIPFSPLWQICRYPSSAISEKETSGIVQKELVVNPDLV